jgi:hypothetical protein
MTESATAAAQAARDFMAAWTAAEMLAEQAANERWLDTRTADEPWNGVR